LKTNAFLDFESDLMLSKTKVRWLDRVDRPYQKVQELLTQNANEVFHRATSTANSRMETEAADLHTKIGGREFRKDVMVKVQSCTDIESESDPKIVIDLEWKATESQFMFPTMFAQLHVFPINTNLTQLDFRGEYEPPMGLFGKAIDKAMGQKIAEGCVRNFVEEVTDYLHKSLTRDD
jgi:hypothetical protein